MISDFEWLLKKKLLTHSRFEKVHNVSKDEQRHVQKCEKSEQIE